jgi:hypothetical protein
VLLVDGHVQRRAAVVVHCVDVGALLN